MSLLQIRISRHPDPADAAVEEGSGGADHEEFDFEGDDDDFDFEVDADEDASEPVLDFRAAGTESPEAPEAAGEIDIPKAQRAAIDTACDGLDSKSFYEILLLPKTADGKAVKRAYYRLSKEYHPDKFYLKQLGPYKARLELLFNKITEAYRVLGDVETRAEYDAMVFGEVGVDTLDHIEAIRGGTSESKPGEASVAVDFVPDALRKKQKEALEKKRKELAAKAKRRRKSQKPVFMQKLQKQLAARIAKSRKHMEAGKEKLDAGDMQAAVTHYQMAMSLDPRNTRAKASFKRVSAQYRNARAEQFYRESLDAKLAEDFKAAAAKLQEAVGCKPTKGKYHNEFGKLIIEHTLQHRVGLEQLRKAVELESRNVPYIMDLAGAYADIGMPSNAVRAYERVLQMDKKNSLAQKALKKLK